MCHEDFALEVRFLRKVRQRCTVIDVEVRDENKIYILWIIEGVKEGQTVAAFSSRMAATIKKDISTLISK